MKIESTQNQKVKDWCKLKEKKTRDETNLFLVEGDHLLQEALKKQVVKEIIATDICYQSEKIPFYEVTEAVIKKMSSQVSSTKVIAVCEKIKPREIKGNVCLLDNIQDPGNLGTIIRSCVAFQIDTLIVSPDTVDPYNEKVIRASEGMLFSLNIKKQDIAKSIEELKQKGYIVFGTNVQNGTDLRQMTIPQKYAIIMGNEGVGLKKELQEQCNENIYIPIHKNCESLNVGVATSIIFYEMERKRNAGN